MPEYSNVEVRAVAAVAQHRGTVRQLVAVVGQDIDGSRASLQAVVAYCAAVVRERHQTLRSCEADPEANCAAERARYQTALEVQRSVERAAAEATAALRGFSQSITEQTERATDWLGRLAAHLDGVGPPPDDVIPMARLGSSGGGGADVSMSSTGGPGRKGASSSSGGGSVIAGLALGADVQRVRVGAIDVASDIFEREPRSTSRDDMVWAAATFRDVVLPHIARGGTKDDLRERDLAAGMATGLRRLEGAWEAFLGDDMPRVVADANGSVVDVSNGRHRIRAAQLAGLSWLPMRVSQPDGNSH